MWLDLDLLDEVRKLAMKESMKYQPWINQKLRDIVLDEAATVEKKIRTIANAVMEKELAEIKKRLNSLESSSTKRKP